MKVDSKPKTRRQIAQELSISSTTFWRWLKKNNICLPKGLVFPAQQKEIYQKIHEQNQDAALNETF